MRAAAAIRGALLCFTLLAVIPWQAAAHTIQRTRAMSPPTYEELSISLLVNQMAILELMHNSLNASRATTRHKTYRLYEYPAIQPQALRACEQLGGRLALPTNEEEEKQINKAIGVSFEGNMWPWTVYWISGTDQQEEGNWIDSVTGQPLGYTNFRPGQPDNKYGEHCLHKTNVFPGWNDAGCDHTGHGYVCEFMDE